MADSRITIQAEIVAGTAVEDARRVGAEVSDAMGQAGSSADKMGRSIADAGAKFRVSADQIRAAAVMLSGVALNIAGKYMSAKGIGQSGAAGYARAAGAGAVQGAAVGMQFGRAGGAAGLAAGAIVGAAVGAGSGALGRRFENEKDAREQSEAMLRQSEALQKSLADYRSARADKTSADEFYRRIFAPAPDSGSDLDSMAQKTAALSARISEFQQASDSLMRSLSSEEVRKDSAQWADLFGRMQSADKEVDRARAALGTLRASDDSSGENPRSPRADAISDSIRRIGGAIGGSGAADDAARQLSEGNGLLRQSAEILRAIRDNTARQGESPSWA